jgi:multiple sugar transport system ATP-binding protein
MELYNRPANKFVGGFIGSPAMNFVDVTITDGAGTVTAEAPGLRLTVPPAKAAALRAYKGQTVTLGVRPEDVRVATAADPGQYAFEATVDVVEPLGSEILLDVRAGGTTIVARVEPSLRVKVHESIRLAVNPERLHFFDVKNEHAI